jgi:hypothetical protein
MAGACRAKNPSSLRTEFVRTHESASCLEIETQMLTTEVRWVLQGRQDGAPKPQATHVHCGAQ